MDIQQGESSANKKSTDSDLSEFINANLFFHQRAQKKWGAIKKKIKGESKEKESQWATKDTGKQVLQWGTDQKRRLKEAWLWCGQWSKLR